MLASDWLSPAMILALKGQCNWTVYASCLSNWTVCTIARAERGQLHFDISFYTSFSG